MILDSRPRVSGYIYPKLSLCICWSFTSHNLQPWCRSCSCANCAAGLGIREHHQRNLPNEKIQAELQCWTKWCRKLELLSFQQKRMEDSRMFLPLPGFFFTWCDRNYHNPTLNCGVYKHVYVSSTFIHLKVQNAPTIFYLGCANNHPMTCQPSEKILHHLYIYIEKKQFKNTSNDWYFKKSQKLRSMFIPTVISPVFLFHQKQQPTTVGQLHGTPDGKSPSSAWLMSRWFPTCQFPTGLEGSRKKTWILSTNQKTNPNPRKQSTN